MSYQSVDLYLKDNTSSKNPIEGVLVRVYGADNLTLYTESVSDSSGHVGFTLYTNTYNIRLYKFGVGFKQPQVLEVLESGLNVFDVQGEVITKPSATDSRLCRASGYFRDITGAPQANVDIHLIGEFNPILLEGAAVLSERRVVRTDKDGFACVDLIRGACYNATVQGFEDSQRQVLVPDLASANLPDMLFPVVSQVTFDQDGPYLLAAGDTLEITPTVIASSGVTLTGTATSDIQWYSSDDAVFSVAPTPTTLVLAAKALGSAELLARRLDGSVIHIPMTEINGVPQSVIVS